MARSELLPTADHQQRHAAPPAVADPAQPALLDAAGPGELVQFQLKQLIRGILAQQNPFRQRCWPLSRMFSGSSHLRE
ncbi:hypothetical protein QFZ33_000798 [Arthrobacter globiformis]|nr:hypothetical protein [Arthrobacter globiformis]